ncbi:MAG TPA: hypothetical protein VGP41_04785 [Candidatus Lustribacter sp.]|nr:hypothetical protein [Candidatus Lustribacter sp.]
MANRADAAAAPLASLSLAARLQTAPDSTLVQFAGHSFTLGALRAAHNAREAAFAQAGAAGVAIAKLNTVQSSATAHTGTKPVTNSGRVAFGVPISTSVVEPGSDYAGAPADMRAFCAGAAASACLYVPAGQNLSVYNNLILDVDAFIDQAQCAKEGGSWSNYGYGWGSGGLECGFSYPTSVDVHFTPSPSFQLQSNVKCDTTLWKPTVDKNGAVVIQLATTSTNFTSGNTPTCVINVTLL